MSLPPYQQSQLNGGYDESLLAAAPVASKAARQVSFPFRLARHHDIVLTVLAGRLQRRPPRRTSTSARHLYTTHGSPIQADDGGPRSGAPEGELHEPYISRVSTKTAILAHAEGHYHYCRSSHRYRWCSRGRCGGRHGREQPQQ